MNWTYPNIKYMSCIIITTPPGSTKLSGRPQSSSCSYRDVNRDWGLGASAATSLCAVVFGIPTYGAGAIGCGIVGGIMAGYAGGVGGEAGGEIMGEYLYEWKP